MVNILPIRHITESDQPVYGANLFNLAKLTRAGIPVPPGIAIAPPEIVLSTLLSHAESSSKEVFEQKLEVIKKDLKKLKIPTELESEIKKYNKFYLNGNVIQDKNSLWNTLLLIWLNEIRGRVWRNGFYRGITSNLTAQAIFPTGKKFIMTTAYFNPDLSEVAIKVQDKITPKILKSLDEIVTRSNNMLVLPQVYTFTIVDEKPYIVAVSPFTQSLPLSLTSDIVLPKNEQRQAARHAVKLFLNTSSGFCDVADGLIIEAEKVKSDDMSFKLCEAALLNTGKPVIFRLPNISDGDIGGTLRLINEPSLLSNFAKVFLFARNKKNLLNVELGIPVARSPNEYAKIKQELASLGINRYGTCKFWLEMSVPENLINIEDYLAIGLDGVILDLDNLQVTLGGYAPHEGEFYKKEISALIKFITPAFKTLHKNHLPVLIKGEITIDGEILDFLIENGAWGIVVNTPLEAESLPEHLSWSERRMVVRRSQIS